LDDGAAHPGRRFAIQIGTLTANLEFLRAPAGELALRIHSITGTANGEVSPLDFLDWIAAEVAWVTKTRATGELGAIEVVGRDLRRAPTSELLESLGFVRRKNTALSCLSVVALGGAGGFGMGYLVFTIDEASVEGGAPEDQRRQFLKKTLGSASAFAFGVGTICIDRVRRDYRLRIEPVNAVTEAPAPGGATRS
jgi:hypothetical protein